MTHNVARRFDASRSELIGVPRERTLGERVQLEAAKLLLLRQRLTLTALAVAMREAAERGSALRVALVAAGVPIDEYYRAVAEVYGVRFVDLLTEPADADLADDDPDYAAQNVVPWRTIDGRLFLATSSITAEHFAWGDERFGPDGYDFVITMPAV
jgi:hypothetical protein